MVLESSSTPNPGIRDKAAQAWFGQKIHEPPTSLERIAKLFVTAAVASQLNEISKTLISFVLMCSPCMMHSNENEIKLNTNISLSPSRSTKCAEAPIGIYPTLTMPTLEAKRKAMKPHLPPPAPMRQRASTTHQVTLSQIVH